MPLAELLHLPGQHFLFGSIQVIAPVLLCAISLAEIQLQRIAWSILCDVIVGVDIQPVIILIRADECAEGRVYIELSLHIKVQLAVLHHDLIAERKILRGEMSRRCELLPVQVIQQLPPHHVLGRILLLHSAVGGCRHVTHRPRCPTVHDVDCGELPLVKFQIKHTGDFSSVLHAETHHGLIAQTPRQSY